MTDYERGYEQGKADATKGANQKPVGWIYIKPKRKHAYVDDVDITQIPEDDEWYPIYLKPQRPWVGLTDEEVAELSAFVYAGDPQYVRLIETKLKEKNT
jgi:hypothetical protein